jgi:GTP cyclohydrolase II
MAQTSAGLNPATSIITASSNLVDGAIATKKYVKSKMKLKLKGNPNFVQTNDYELLNPQASMVMVAQADLPTKWGNFRIVGFYEKKTGKEHTAIIKGDVTSMENVPLRVHSQCHTGDVLGSLRCDCQAQLEFALEYLGTHEKGVVLYLMQEGRGIGLLNKIKAYQLQDLGLDTVEANVFLGFKPDQRRYKIAAEMIDQLDIKSIELMTNNVEKIEGLKKEGVKVNKRIPVIVGENKFNFEYLKTKKEDMGHLL